ncbi:MAG: 2-C-methyl-D-erythritol 4-phosphate cytidylyltransferase [Microbacteriaceae bacterium]|nr:2-C-methyl-D-erythritol 4-phosphate cytidylyltransferase [Microbacteriaceae bacterium]
MSSSAEPRVAVIVVAAGSGTRLGADLPKAFVEIAGTSILGRALHSVFGMAEPVQAIVVAPAELVSAAASIARGVAGEASSRVAVVAGGETRQASVAAGLAVIGPSVQIVLVHDAARALAPSVLFDAVASEVRRLGHGVIPGLAVSDTIKRTDAAGDIRETVDRSELTAVQTPQGFPREHILAAYEAAREEFTDDAALVVEAGYHVSLVSGDPLAFKITTPADRRRAEDLCGNGHGAPRIGIGTDTHAFQDDNKELWLAGLYWPGEPGLAGHSDGDAVAHAVTDALLAASGLGDIGSVFGTGDPQYEGAHGEVFLRHTRTILESAGFRIGNVSVQLIGNRPRFTARRAEAEALLEEYLGSPVSVSATTTDRLGFTGRGEGVTAIATALCFFAGSVPAGSRANGVPGDERNPTRSARRLGE